LSVNPVTGEAASTRFGGDLKTFALPDVLEFLRLQAKTGSLVVSSRMGAGIVRLVRGQLTSATAPGVPRMGEVLLARGIVTRAALDQALDRQRASGPESTEALGTVLLREQPSQREKLSRVVFEQLLEALDEMLAWSEGAFSFHPENDADAPTIAFDLQNVMLEVMRIRDERTQNAEGAKEDR